MKNEVGTQNIGNISPQSKHYATIGSVQEAQFVFYCPEDVLSWPSWRSNLT